MRNSIENRDRVLRAQGATALVAFTLMLGTAGRMLQSRPVSADAASHDAGLAIADHAIEDANRREMPRPAQGPSAIRAHGPSGNAASFVSEKDAAQAFHGTVVREGLNYMLRDSSGEEYRLDAMSSAQAFEGRPVKVSGQLEESSRLIHVQEIEEPGREGVIADPAP
jgi:hypothetical protein